MQVVQRLNGWITSDHAHQTTATIHLMILFDILWGFKPSERPFNCIAVLVIFDVTRVV